jgi:hypothetical protein
MEQKEPENAARGCAVLRLSKWGSATLRMHMLKPKARAPMLAESSNLKIQRNQTSQRAQSTLRGTTALRFRTFGSNTC